MATWHQKRNPVPLYMDNQWVVVTDPPNKMCSSMVFNTHEEAQGMLQRLTEHGKGKYSYILPPSNLTRLGN